MDAPTPIMASEITELHERRGRHYPTRDDYIRNEQDRADWIQVACNLMTQNGKKPENIGKIAGAKSNARIDVLKSFTAKKPQRSLWNILVGIIQSTERNSIIAPTVSQLDRLFEELAPIPPSSALIAIGHVPRLVTTPTVIVPHLGGRAGRVGAHTRVRVSSVLIEQQDLEPGGDYDVSHFEQLTVTQKKVLSILGGYTSGPENSPASYKPNPSLTISDIAQQLDKSNTNVYTLMWLIRGRIRDIQEAQEFGVGDSESSEDISSTSSSTIRSGKREKYTPDKLPNLAGINDLYPYLQSAIFAWYGYDGNGDPANPTSYDVSRAKTSQQIALEQDVPINRIQTYLSIARKALGWLPEDTIDPEATISEKPLIELLATQVEGVAIPARFQKRIMPTPLPKRDVPTQLTHTGETKQTLSPGQGARVIAPPRKIPQQHVYVAPKPPPVTVKKSGAPATRISWKPRREDSPEIQPSFEALIEQAPAGGRVFQREETPPEPAPKPVLRAIPEFVTYREALEWGQKQDDWIWGIALWRNSTPLSQRDDMGADSFLKSPTYLGLKTFLDRVRDLSGKPHFRYTKIFDALFESLPEEKIGLLEIQRNSQWMGLIKNAFDQHEAGNHDGFVITIQTILGDERLGEALFAMMPEYDTTDYMDILALIAGRNWTLKDVLKYEHRTLKDIIGYEPGKYASLDTILREGAHVGKKTLKRELQDILLKVPIGRTSWSRFQEKDCPEVSLYEIIVALVRVEDRESPKVLFHKLEEILGVG